MNSGNGKRMRFLSAVLCLALLFSLSACGETKKAALSVQDVPVDKEVYTYFLEREMQNGTKLKKQELLKAASRDCADYVKINTEFAEYGLKLSSLSKAQVAREVNNIWNIYGGYYKEIGVSKQTLTKVTESEAYRKAIILSLYGEKGKKAVSKEAQKEFFKEKNVFFKVISAYLYTKNSDGKAVRLSGSELEALKQKFENMRKQLSEGATMETVNKSYEENIGGTAPTELPVNLAREDSDIYPAGFFKDAAAVSSGEAAVLCYDKYLFLIQKKDAGEYFEDYAEENLVEMTADSFKKERGKKYAKFKIKDNERIQKKCYSLISDAKSKRA